VTGPLTGTLRVLVHQNAPFVEFMDTYNADFEAANPAVNVDMSVVAVGDVATSIQTRLAAQTVDVIDYCAPPCAGFSNAVQPYMSGVGPPLWQQLIEAGLILDVTNEAFVQNFDQASIKDAATFNGRVYAINMGRIAYSGMFVNNTLLANLGLALPTTWSQLVTACETIKASGNHCMTVGGADNWPVFVGSYGILGAMYPDQAALVEGLWKGTVKWNDAKGLELIDRYHTYATEMLHPEATGLGHDAATGRFALGDVAFMPTGSWQAPNLEGFGPGFNWTYVPFPGSDNPADNQYLFGKYDLSFMIAADTPQPNLAKAYLAGLSDPTTYQQFVNETGFLPTQPTATLDSTLGQAVAPLLENFQVGFEQYWVSPSGAGQWANASQAASWFAPFGPWIDPVALANRAQADLEAGLPTP
jgi:raffinose/stachyose/melibiose transport system substrate-binding protein